MAPETQIVAPEIVVRSPVSCEGRTMASFVPSSHSYGVAGGRGPGDFGGYDPLLPEDQKHKMLPAIALIAGVFTMTAFGAWLWMRKTANVY